MSKLIIRKSNTLILCILFSFIPNCASQNNLKESHADPSSVISSLEKINIGGTDQWILSRGNDIKKPVLLIVHGGPGAASIGFARYFYNELEKHFIVVNWDQRGSGKSFSFFMPEVTPETYVSDTVEVILFLKKKFNTKKVFLMGHSWGGYIGAIVAHRHPEHLLAYIGIGAVVHGEQSARISYEFILNQARKDPALASQANDLTLTSYLENRRKWLNKFGVGMFHGNHRNDEDEFLRGVMFDSPDYSLMNMVTYLPGIWKTSSRIRPFFFKMDLFKEAPEIKVPVYFFSGRFDYYNPGEILEQYVSVLKSPKKSIHWFECCAHAPHFETPDDFAAKLISAIDSK
ncbi:alpha/beta hydrolase [Leptospira kobayashii]|uniref:Alpha/beta hydrolase n=1 Tax=Leptospira kobayashii TaxID=1917830 RepID=A0ABM7UTI0_9LEPT|nr:alpha/beta hydrolase [Leptospira kobayashii]BDA80286.1 alpha/beta hydrolase [Leptospira kobayashii]